MNRDDYISVAFGGLMAFLFLCSVAFAGEQIPCWKAKAFLAYHGNDLKAAKAAARGHGFTWAQIADAERRCK